jgi:hypothetical protein
MLTRTSTALRRAATGLPALAFVGAGMGAWTGSATAAEERTYQVKTTLDGRTVKDPDIPLGSKRIADMYAAGSPVTLVCQDRGPSYGGSNIWDHTTDNLWVPDEYVKTGITGFVKGLPHYDTDGLRPGVGDGGTNTHGRNTGPACPTTGARQQKGWRAAPAARTASPRPPRGSTGAGTSPATTGSAAPVARFTRSRNTPRSSAPGGMSSRMQGETRNRYRDQATKRVTLFA